MSGELRGATTLAGLYLFGIGFGFVEAVVVVDLRAILGPVAVRVGGVSSVESLPMIPIDRIASEDPASGRLLRIEMLREAATLAVLTGVAIAAGRSFLGRFSAFVVGFGLWDLAYYAFLKLLIGWPESVWTWDLLFLIPVPWAAPVLAPSIVAATMVVTGSVAIVEEAMDRPMRMSRWDWLAIVVGGLVLTTSFCWEWRLVASGGVPVAFPWAIFALGETMALAGFLHGWRTGHHFSSDPPAPFSMPIA